MPFPGQLIPSIVGYSRALRNGEFFRCERCLERKEMKKSRALDVSQDAFDASVSRRTDTPKFQQRCHIRG